MLQKDKIRDFLSQKTIAVIGVSRNGDLPANYIFKKLLENDYTVYPVNPNADYIGDYKCYADLESLPGKPEAVLIAGTPAVTEETVKKCVDTKVNHIWMHKGMGEGSYSPAAERYCRAHGITPIVNGCPMMFVGHVDFFHKIMRWVKS